MLVSILRRCDLEIIMHALEVGSHAYTSLRNKNALQAIFHDMSSKEVTMLHHQPGIMFCCILLKIQQRMGEIRYVVNTP